MNPLKPLYLIFCLLLTVIFFACSEQAHDESRQSGPTVLPGESGISECIADDLPELQVCEWADSLDAVVIGTIVSANLIKSPAFKEVTMAPVNDCPTIVGPALRITLDVKTVLSGQVKAGEQLTFHIGSSVLFSWNVGLTLNDKDQWTWNSNTQPFKPGRTLGAPLRQYGNDKLWSLGHEPLFTLDEKETFQFQKGYCGPYFPSVLQNSTLQESQREFTKCTGTSAAGKKRADVIISNWPDPVDWIGALCTLSEEEALSQDGCWVHSECEDSELCIERACVLGDCINDQDCIRPDETCINNFCKS